MDEVSGKKALASVGIFHTGEQPYMEIQDESTRYHGRVITSTALQAIVDPQGLVYIYKVSLVGTGMAHTML